ncbi:MAG: aspartate aminotransferase family protein [Phycisphaerae bacterium]|nr:aspartate aminotransferase family protein [Phycisphaerae bacterium]
MAQSQQYPDLPSTPLLPRPYRGLSRQQVSELRQQYLSPALLLYYSTPIMIVEGRMQYVWDDRGKRYVDAFGGIAAVSIGHCHPHVAKAVQEQVETIQHTTVIYLHPTIARFAEKLAGTFPAGSGLQVSYFTNSGSESNDLALLMCRLYTGRFDAIALRNGYHGGTHAAMALTAQSTWKFPIPHSFGVHFGMPGYCYRCPMGLCYPACDLKCARDVAETILYETPGEIACFICEAIQGVGGVIVPPPDYLKIIYEAVRKAGGLCIADEVQAGLGRIGERFWAFEYWGVVPDMVTMAKGIGNGAALGAVVTRMDVAKGLAGRLHFNTFGGNPVAAAAGLATLEAIGADHLRENARNVGGHLKNRLLGMQERHPLIGEVRGMGLMLGMELVRDRQTREPARDEAHDVAEQAKEHGLLIGTSGIFGNTIRLTPPLCFTKDDADFAADCLDQALAEAESRMR